MLAQPKFDRRGWLALWLQDRRRARQSKVPLTPGNFAGVDTSVVIQLTWQDRSADELGFRVYRRVNAGAFGLWQTLAANVTTVQDSGVSLGVLYSYYIVSFNANGESFPSNTLQFVFGA